LGATLHLGRRVERLDADEKQAVDDEGQVDAARDIIAQGERLEPVDLMGRLPQ
jgi:NADPH-dependent 2,4-dienoyl-CoA reductase/sulfur reductase-like enzyme